AALRHAGFTGLAPARTALAALARAAHARSRRARIRGAGVRGWFARAAEQRGRIDDSQRRSPQHGPTIHPRASLAFDRASLATTKDDLEPWDHARVRDRELAARPGPRFHRRRTARPLAAAGRLQGSRRRHLEVTLVRRGVPRLDRLQPRDPS